MSAATLASLFRARSVALVGATDRSIWSTAAFANFERLGFTGRVHPVSRKGGLVHGLPAAASCAAIGEPVDAALLMVPEGAIAEAFADLNAAGIRNAVVLTSGFAEIGEAGARKQEALLAAARAEGVTLLGPNCLGFINYADRVPIWTTQPPLPVIPGGAIGIVSQSGATAGFLAAFAQRQGIGLSYQVSTGNEADVNVARVVDFLVDDPATKVIGLFLETVHDAPLLAEAARRALAADKPIVAIKIGASETAARAAEAHTGSLVGDDRVFEAVCRQLGILRVSCIEDLVFTAGLLAKVGHLRDRRLGLVSISGGICEMAADHAEANGIAVPRLAEGTKTALKDILPAFGTANNPLDVTGGAMLDPALFARSLPAFAADPAVGLVACFMDVPDTPEEIAGYRGTIVRQIGEGFRAAGKPAVMLSVMARPVTEAGRALLEETGIAYLGSGVLHGLGALGRAVAWAERQERGLPARAAPPAPATERPRSEHATLDYLESRGVPVVPMRLARSAEEAVTAARELRGPAVLKIASPDIAHKSDIGGVLLNLSGEEAVAAGFERIMSAVRLAKPQATIDGVLVAPMRAQEGVELFVGVLRDPLWGPAIAVGLGGIWVEALRDTAIRLLPVAPAEVLEMFSELRGAKLLDGYRGMPGIDRQAAAEAVARIGDAALALGPALASLEVNPLRATAEGAEALDALALFEEEG
ncbi:acetate--CoA ligase family protein [Paracraurococcus lichenis]|uniref:Acetate--CoA ligase family protein n=1 Tax=Paracraurococcus lichenis TaxID=3064888 RepID=A0ABT9DSP2_9PROT|nr:acetate--CoA ligase family protein [Paracraurococcus sp. LOR1-02]MDO9706896.1 acetate--CoA ligase family protein [Paracraurococcus sp. LOR1-02]